MVRNTEFGIIDVETTGLFPKANDRIVEIAVIRTNSEGKILGEYSTLVNPNRDIGPTHIHGISARDVKNAPPFNDIAGDVVCLLAGTILVGHNVYFDKRFLEAEMERIDCMIPNCPCLCTMKLAHRADPKLPSRKLLKICDYFGIPLENAHTAINDAKATLELMKICFYLIGGGEDLKLSDIWIEEKHPSKEFWPAIEKKDYHIQDHRLKKILKNNILI